MIHVPDSLIDEIVRRLLRASSPDRIVLFGSTVAGEPSDDSDIDLLVLMPSISDPRKESVRLRRALGDLNRPIDVIPLETQRFEEEKDVVGGVAYPADKYGKVIYERP